MITKHTMKIQAYQRLGCQLGGLLSACIIQRSSGQNSSEQAPFSWQASLPGETLPVGCDALV
jgi:hypothetical protein